MQDSHRIIGFIVAIALMLTSYGCNSTNIGDAIPPEPGYPLNCLSGYLPFTTLQPQEDGGSSSCTSWHGDDGSGGSAPSLLGQPASSIFEHTRGDGAHPEGVKYPDLSPNDISDMAAFLAEDRALFEICQNLGLVPPTGTDSPTSSEQ